MSPPVVDSPPVFGHVEQLRIVSGASDTLIRHLFSVGLSLHETRTMVSDLAQVRLDATIGELDLAIRELRSLVFGLTHGPPGDRDRA